MATMSDDDNSEDPEVLRAKLVELKTEHRDLDDAINAMDERGVYDTIKVQRLKKRKLALKDQIIRLENALVPDIIA
jgi:hypothetical protein